MSTTTGFLPKGSVMVAALYHNLDEELKALHNFAICEDINDNTFDFLFGNTEINPENTYTLEFYYWNGLENVIPIDLFDAIYEEIYVSTEGNDQTGTETFENPYNTIQKALEKVDEINEYQWGDIIVNVEGGTYTLSEGLAIDERYSGKNGYNVIIRGEENNMPLINGGIKVDEWVPDTKGIWKAPLTGIENVRNLYINGYPAIMARSERHYNTAEKQKMIWCLR